MAALHDALKALGPLSFDKTPLDNLKPFLANVFSKGQLLVDSVPIPAAAGDSSPQEGRSRASSSASSASEITSSTARSTPPPPDVEALQKEWKQVKLSAKDNPLGMNVYKTAGKDGKGAWFARRSVHEGLGFTRWKRGLEREFPETLKVQGGPGEGNIRGIGGERRVECQNVDGVGKMEVYLLSAQFPGPTAPRDFVTMVLTSDQALLDQSGGEQDVPRHFMVISRPCSHPDAPPRDGFIRGKYESVEFIREIPIHKPPPRSASTSNLPSTRNRATSSLSRDAIVRNAKKNHSPPNGEDGPGLEEPGLAENGRARGSTISFDKSRGSEAKGENVDIHQSDHESESNPIEWIMITRSDPGGSVPQFMIERGTPGGIVSDATKFLDWACSKDMEDPESDNEPESNGAAAQGPNAENHGRTPHHHDHEKDLHNHQTNGHLAGIEPTSTPIKEAPKDLVTPDIPPHESANGGLYGMITDAAGIAGGFISAHTAAIISSSLPHADSEPPSEPLRRDSVSSISSVSSVESFASALENYNSNDVCSSTESSAQDRVTASQDMAAQDKKLQKLEERKRKLDEKLARVREKGMNKKSEDSAKEEEAMRKAKEKHDREEKKQEEKYRKEVEKLERKKEKEAQKAEDRRKKAAERDDKLRLLKELDEIKAEVIVLRKEREILRGQVGDLQAENTMLAAKIGRLAPHGENVLHEIRAAVGQSGKTRADSPKVHARTSSYRSTGSSEKTSDNLAPTLPTKP